MPAYEFYSPAPVFLDALGLQPLAGGNLYFYDQGTTNARNTWSDSGLTTLNANPVPLDSAGRASTAVFLDGSYTVVCKDSLGVTIWTRDVIPGGSSGTSIPTLETGLFLTNDGTNLDWQTVRQMPDATGSTGQYPVTNGAGGYTLQNTPTTPTIPDPQITVGANSFQAGISTDATKFIVLTGSTSAAASGGRESSATVAFATPFDTLEHISITITGSGITAYNDCPRLQITSQSVTGFTVRFNTGENSTAGGWDITAAIPFSWAAFGTREIP